MHRIRLCGKTGGTLETEEKDLGVKGRNSSVRLFGKIQLQSKGNHHEQNNVVQILVHVQIVQSKKYGFHKGRKKSSRFGNV